jgi:hypothetical protein
VQSIELEREPYESEVSEEIRKRKEEKRNATKKQRKTSIFSESINEERMRSLEARVTEGEAELVHVKQEMRSLMSEVLAFKESRTQSLA